jgi:hypothetical protein
MSARQHVVAPATACEVEGFMIEGASPISIATSPPKTATMLHRSPGRQAREPCTRIASAIAIAYAITSSDPQPVA